MTRAWGFSTGGAYAANSYPRAALAIEQIRRLIGEERFWRTFRAYAERWRFDHPSSEDFLGLFRSSAPLDGLIDQTWYGAGTVDYKVVSASSKPSEEMTGFDDEGKAVNFSEDQKQKEEKKVDEKKDPKKRRYDTTVVIGRLGEMAFPVDVVLTFEDGKTHKAAWDGKSRWLRLKTTYASKLAKAEVDPGLTIVLDRDPLNNAKVLESGSKGSGASKVRTYASHLLEIVLSSLWAVV
jgi:hypothetical protein